MAEACGFRLRTSGCDKHGLCFEAKMHRLRFCPPFQKFGKLWLAAEVLLFVLVGASVDIRYTLKAGPAALAMIFAALLIRTLGVSLCVTGTNLTWRERLFCSIAYLPKATVQAAIGSVPMAMGLSCGQIVLSVAVLGILITAPLGAIGMDCSYKKLLSREIDKSQIFSS